MQLKLKKIDHLVTRKLFKKWFHRQYISLMNQQTSSNQTVEHLVYEQSPIIVVGMHRSGTSLLIDALTSVGLFAGDITGPDTSESLLFQYLNDAALFASQAHWSNPENLAYTLKNEKCVAALAKLYGQSIESHWRHMYKLSEPQKTLNGEAGPFGWKDPRNCLTIPLWSKLYPNARYIFINRHGVDVAQSHVNRENRINNSVYISRCLDLNRSFSLWEEYNRQALDALALIDEKQKISFSFEELLKSPEEKLSELAKFCGLTPDQSKLEAFVKRCDPNKAYAYKKQALEIGPEIKNSDMLQTLGYSI